jgi:hypothetical protein
VSGLDRILAMVRNFRRTRRGGSGACPATLSASGPERRPRPPISSYEAGCTVTGERREYVEGSARDALLAFPDEVIEWASATTLGSA